MSIFTQLSALKLGVIIIGGVGVILVAGVAAGLYQTYRVEHRPNQAVFAAGTIPANLPNGFYKGNHFGSIGRNWQGKVFDASQSAGLNQFTDGQRFKFKIYTATGLRDTSLSVLRIDYKQPGNPWWLRFITDEIVQTQPGHFVGKIQLRIVPGLTFTLSYFELTKVKPSPTLTN
jgi:hypothetical protein